MPIPVAGVERKILILDPDCKEMSGHHYQTNKSLISNLGNAQVYLAVRSPAYETLEFGSGVKICRWPSVSKFSNRLRKIRGKSRLNSAAQLALDSKFISRIIKKVGLSRDDVVIVHSADKLILSLPDAFRSIDKSMGPSFFIRFLDVNSIKQDKTEFHRKLVKEQKVRGNVAIFSETQETAQSLELEYGYAPVRQWIVPLAMREVAESDAKQDPKDVFVVGFLGGKRPDQQPGSIPEIVQSLLGSKDNWPVSKFKLLIQAVTPATRQPEFYESAMKTLNSILASESDGRVIVEMLPPDLSEVEFRHAVAMTHLLVLPYDMKQYGNRGSGLVIEGALSGTPVAVPAGFAMRHWSEMAGSPSCAGSHEFAQAILNVAADYETFCQGASRAGVHMRSLIEKRIAEIRFGNSGTESHI